MEKLRESPNQNQNNPQKTFWPLVFKVPCHGPQVLSKKISIKIKYFTFTIEKRKLTYSKGEGKINGYKWKL